MNNSLLDIARRNRTAALATLQVRKQVIQSAGDVLCLQSMREKLDTKPIFRSVRVHRFEDRCAA